MFFKKKGKKEVDIAAPVNGKIINLKDVPDVAFSEEMVGKGVAVIPEGNEIYSPVEGKITTVFITGHAIGITTKEGIDLLMHIGMDTVNLKGEGFAIKVKDGKHIKKGDLLLVVDFDKLRKKGYRLETPIIICNHNQFANITYAKQGYVNKGDVLMKVEI